MQHFSQTLIQTLIHSLWQSALLMIAYKLVTSFFNRQSPLLYRNMLFGLLSTQLVLSIICFTVIYTHLLDTDTERIHPFSIDTMFPTTFWKQIAPVLTGIYTVVLAVQILITYRSWLSCKTNLSADLLKAPVDLTLFTRKTSRALGIKKDVTLWISKSITTPLTHGFLKPVVVLPFALVNNLNLREAESLILHELSHIKNNDYILNWLVIVIENIFFFNPFTRSMIRQFRLEREKACDLNVLDFTYHPVQYAETLMKAARHNINPSVLQVSAVFNESQLIQRVRFFMDDKKTNHINKGTAPLMLIRVLSALIVLFAIFQLSAYRKTSNLLMAFRINNSATNDNAYTKSDNHFGNKPFIMVIPDNEHHVLLQDNIQTNKPATVTRNPVNSDVESGYALQHDESHPVEPVYRLIPVAETTEENSKEFIIKEENPASGITTTSAFRIRLKDGEWIREFLWMMTETKPSIDSLSLSHFLLLLPERL